MKTWSSNMPRNDSSNRPTFAKTSRHQCIAVVGVCTILDQADQKVGGSMTMSPSRRGRKTVACGRVRITPAVPDQRAAVDHFCLGFSQRRDCSRSFSGSQTSSASRNRCNGRARGRGPVARGAHAAIGMTGVFEIADPAGIRVAKPRAMAVFDPWSRHRSAATPIRMALLEDALDACARNRSSLRKMMMAETSGARHPRTSVDPSK